MKPSARRVASVSVDLDPLSCYYRIHDLGPTPKELADVVLRRAVPRLLQLFAQTDVRATFFVVAAELEGQSDPARAARALVQSIVQAGHEIANHSFSHPYDLARWERKRAAHEIGRAHALIGDVVGRAPVGFRAPGYDISAAMLDALARLGYLYDSSIFPAPGYYVAKVAVMAALWAAGQRSGAVMTNPRALWAPTEPYRLDGDRPWRRGQFPLIELPIAVTPFLRIPVIGTNIAVAPAPLRSHWLARMRRRAFFNLELHGLDVLDAEQDGIPSQLAFRQRDLRVPLATKLAAFAATLASLAADYELLLLRDAATRYQREGKVG